MSTPTERAYRDIIRRQRGKAALFQGLSLALAVALAALVYLGRKKG